MDIAKNIFILAAMVIVSASVGFVAWANGGLMISEAAIAGTCVLVVQFVGYLMVWKVMIYEKLQKNIHELTLNEAENANGVERLSNEMHGLRKVVKTATQAEIEPLARELEVISSLIKQLAENSADTDMRIADLQQKVAATQKIQEAAKADPISNKTAAKKKKATSQKKKIVSQQEEELVETDDDAEEWLGGPIEDKGDDTAIESSDPVSKEEIKDDIIFEKAPIDEPIDYNSTIVKAVRSAVDENKIDLYLQPIVTLPQRKPKFYEALSRIRSDDGDLIRPSQYLRSAEQTGAMPILDKMLLVRAVQVLQRLLARKSDAVVVCNISANSLADTRFFNDFRMLLKAKSDLADHLIFEFNQETVKSFGAIEEESIRALKELGFRFAVDNVTEISMDFHRLVDMGFHFMKVSADILLSAKVSAIKDIHPQDIPRYLARNGINLIVDHIETESQIVELLEFDVSLGQGFLFAAPREVKPDATTSVRSQAIDGKRLAS